MKEVSMIAVVLKLVLVKLKLHEGMRYCFTKKLKEERKGQKLVRHVIRTLKWL